MHGSQYSTFREDTAKAKEVAGKASKQSKTNIVSLGANQTTLKDIVGRKTHNEVQFHKLVTNAVIDAHLSARVVENRSFKALLKAGFSGMTITRERITSNIERDFEDMTTSLIKKLETISSNQINHSKIWKS